MAALAEKLPNLDFVMSMGLPNDVPAEVGDLAQFAAMLAGTRKPLLTTAHDAVSLRRMKDMAALCGEAQELRLLRHAQPAAHPRGEALDKVRACAELDIPLVYAPAPAAGTTAPASMTATIVIGNAETLSGLVVHQLTRSGAPFVYGVGCGAFDMRTAVDVYGAPEHFLGNAAATDLARFYGLRASPTRRSPTPRASTSSGPPRPASRRCSARSAAPRCCTTSATSRAACRAATRRSSSATSWWATPARCSSRWASTTRRWR